jgi:hypothetical protein
MVSQANYTLKLRSAAIAHLAIDVQEWGGTAFTWADSDGKPTGGTTVWSVGPEEGDQFAPSKASFMVNYRVDDLHAVVTVLKGGRLQRPRQDG